jgi:hypothetical protein
MSDIVVIDTTADLATYKGDVRIKFSPSRKYLAVTLDERLTTYFACLKVDYTVPIEINGVSNIKKHKFETKCQYFDSFLDGDLHFFEDRTLECTKVATMESRQAVFEFKSRDTDHVFLKLVFDRQGSETAHMTVDEEYMYYKSLVREAETQERIDDALTQYMKGWQSRMELITNALKTHPGQDYRALTTRVDHQNLNHEDTRKAILKLSDDFRRKASVPLLRAP